jgi:urocanate hydratase
MCFDYGFGPFRWVCGSGKPEDLAKLMPLLVLF